jgi:hypothetical protein
MPTIPLYNRNASLPGALPYEKASLAVPVLLSNSVENFTETVTRDTDRLMGARRANDFSQKTLEATKEFNDLDRWTDTQTDFKTMPTTYQTKARDLRAKYTAEIEDPTVRNLFLKDFDRMAIRGLNRTKELAVNLEGDANRANLLNTLSEYSQLVATAPTFGLASERVGRARAAIAGAVATKAIDEERGAALDKHFSDSAYTNYIKREILQDPKRVNDDLEAGKYTGLDEHIKTDLLKYSGNMATAKEHEQLQLANQKRIADEKEVKDRREGNAMQLSVFAMQGKLTKPQLIEAGRMRLIDQSDMFQINNLIEKTEGGEDDPATRLDMFSRIMDGTVKPRDIFARVGQGLSTKTAESFLEKLKTVGREDDISKNPIYRDAKKYIEDNLKMTGPGAQVLDPGELQRMSRAFDEFDVRARKGEDIRNLRDDIVNRYRPSAITVNEFPKPIYGTKKDPVNAFKRTKSAYEAGQISLETYNREIRNLDALLTILESEEQANPQPGKSSESPAAKAIKARKNAL